MTEDLVSELGQRAAEVRKGLAHTPYRDVTTGAHASWCRGCKAEAALVALVAAVTEGGAPRKPREAKS